MYLLAIICVNYWHKLLTYVTIVLKKEMFGMDKNITVIEKRIKALRDQALYTQEELANKLHVSRSLINNWENGYANISLRQLIKISYLYKVPLDYILGIINKIDNYNYSYIEDIDLRKIGSTIRSIRKNANLTQDEFAKKIDTKRSNISYYEIGRMMISTADLKQICETFGVSADYIVGNIDINIKRNKKINLKTKEIKAKVSNK